MVCDVGGMHKLFEVTYVKWPFYWFVPFTKIYSMRHHHSYVLCQFSFEISLFINNRTTLTRKLKAPNTSTFINGKKGCSYKSLYGAKMLRKSYTI